MRVLITGLFEPGGLAAVRRLGRMGAEVVAADCHRMAYGMYSKHVTRRVALPSLRENPAEYAQAVLRELEASEYDYYFPSYEEVVLLSHFRERLLRKTHSVLPPHEALINLHDKSRLADLAERAGVATPTAWYPGCADEVRELASRLGGTTSVVKLRQGAGASGMRVVRDPSALPRVFEEVVQANAVPEGYLPLVQRWVEGETVCSLELCYEGEPVGQVFFRGLRTVPRQAGTTVLRETVSAPECAEASRALVAELGYTGFVGFDYVVKEGIPHVVDANPRLTPALSLAQQAGCDMVPAWLAIADGRRPEPLGQAQLGIRSKTQFGDVAWLLESYWRSVRHWRAEREMRRGWWRDKRCPDDVAQLADPLPNIVLWLYILSHLPQAALSKRDASELFMFHNRYVEYELGR